MSCCNDKMAASGSQTLMAKMKEKQNLIASGDIRKVVDLYLTEKDEHGKLKRIVKEAEEEKVKQELFKKNLEQQKDEAQEKLEEKNEKLKKLKEEKLNLEQKLLQKLKGKEELLADNEGLKKSLHHAELDNKSKQDYIELLHEELANLTGGKKKEPWKHVPLRIPSQTMDETFVFVSKDEVQEKKNHRRQIVSESSVDESLSSISLTFRGDCKDLQVKLEGRDKQIQDLMSMIERKVSMIKKLTEDIREHRSTNAQKSNQLKHVYEVLDAKQMTCIELETALYMTRQELTEEKDRCVKKLEKDLRKQHEDMNLLYKEHEQAQKDLSALGKERDDLMNMKESQQEQLDSLKDRISDLVNVDEVKSQSIASHLEKVQSLENEVRQMKGDKKQFEDEMYKKEAHVKMMRESLSEQNETISEQYKEIKALKEEIKDSEMKRYQADPYALEDGEGQTWKSVSLAGDYSKELTTKMNEKVAYIGMLETTNHEKTQKVEVLESELHMNRDTIATLQYDLQEMENLNSEVNHLKQNVNVLKQKEKGYIRMWQITSTGLEDIVAKIGKFEPEAENLRKDLSEYEHLEDTLSIKQRQGETLNMHVTECRRDLERFKLTEKFLKEELEFEQSQLENDDSDSTQNRESDRMRQIKLQLRDNKRKEETCSGCYQKLTASFEELKRDIESQDKKQCEMKARIKRQHYEHFEAARKLFVACGGLQKRYRENVGQTQTGCLELVPVRGTTSLRLDPYRSLSPRISAPSSINQQHICCFDVYQNPDQIDGLPALEEKESVLSESILSMLSKEIGNECRELATHLGISTATYEQYKEMYKSSFDLRFNMLLQWRRKYHDETKDIKDALIQALKYTERNDLAEQLAERIENKN